jgi:hypothetical protein
VSPRSGQLELTLALDSAEARAAEWARRAHANIYLADTGWHFTADDIRALAGDPPAHGDAMGAVFRSAARAGLIVCTGTTTSKRPDAHGRLLREWRRL